MPRRIRLDSPRSVHHVMMHALCDESLFLSADDRQDFVDRLVRLLPECEARCLAWVLMTNHVHLVVQMDTGELSRVMRRLNTGYAVRFNRVHERRGYVFRDRFLSRIVTGAADLINLIRYVHRNPLEAGLVASLAALAQFPWSAHGALIGSRRPLAFEAVGEALLLFDDEPQRARAELMAWMARDDPGPELPPASFPAPAPEFSRTEAEPCGRLGLVALLSAASKRYAVTADELRSGSKQQRIARARAVVAWVGVVELGISGRQLAKALGVTPPAVSSALDRGRRAAAEDGFHAADLGRWQGI